MIDLSKGQTFDLSKGDDKTERKKKLLDHMHVGLGWDVKKGGGVNFDLDVKVASQRADGTWDPDYACNYSHKVTPDKAIKHCGDNLTGEGSKDDEVIKIHLSKLPPQIVLVEFFVEIYQARQRRQHFGQVHNAFIRLVDRHNHKKEVCRFTLGHEYDMYTSVLMGTARRNASGDWGFVAEGKPRGEKLKLLNARARATEASSLIANRQEERETCNCNIM